MRTSRPRTTRPPSPTTHTPARRRQGPIAIAALLAIGFATLVLPGPVASAGAVPTASAATVPAPEESWAWGALANFSGSVQYVGAYNTSQNLTGGNWTTSGAYVAIDESVGVQYGAFVIVNATTPSPGTRYVHVEAAELRAEHLAVAASGTFPVPGNYTANGSVPLAPRNFSLTASVATLDLAAAYLNFTTGANGSLALANEHVESAEGINISLDDQQFPNITRDSAGNLDVRYVTGAITASAWLVENLTASFAPALPLVEGPVTVGKSWYANSTASFNGSVAWAESVHATAGNGATGAVSNSGSASAKATVPVALMCRVIGTTTLRDPNGTAETDDVIACANSSGSEAYLATNGLVVLPTSSPGPAAGLAAGVPVHPATAPLAPGARATGASLYSPSRHLAASERASPAAGDEVTASPMSVSAAQTAMHGLGTPVRPAPVAPHGSAMLAVLVIGGSAAAAVGGIALLAWRNRGRR